MIDAKGRYKRFDFKEPFQDPKKVLLRIMQGNGEITSHCNIPTQKASSYMSTYTGLLSKDIDLNIGDHLKTMSNFIGAVSPDHTTFNWGKE